MEAVSLMLGPDSETVTDSLSNDFEPLTEIVVVLEGDAEREIRAMLKLRFKYPTRALTLTTSGRTPLVR